MKCKTDLANPVTFNGLQLELERCQHIPLQATFRPPMHRSRSGAFGHFTEQELALHTMACLGNDVCVHKVRVQRLVHADLTLDTVVTAGVFDEFLPITITAPVVVEVAAGGRGRGRGRRAGRGAGRGAGGDAGPIDFMFLFDAEPRVVARGAAEGAAWDEADADPHRDPGGADALMKSVAAALGLPEQAIQDFAEAGELLSGLETMQMELLVPEEFIDEVEIVLNAAAEAVEEEEEEEEEDKVVELLIEMSPGVFHNPGNKWIGQIQTIGAGRKATCKAHPHCVCWVSREADIALLEGALKDWLRSVAGPEPASAVQHLVDAYHLQVRFGMKLRKPPGVE